VTLVSHISGPEVRVQTLPGQQLPGTWRYSSRLALVLSGGGARAAYQLGILAGLAERLPGLEFPILAGVSAGAINIAYLAAHAGPFPAAVAGLRQAWARLTSDQVYRVRPVRLVRSAGRWMLQGAIGGGAPTTVRGLVDTLPLREFLSRTINLLGIDANVAAGRLRAVALSATSYTAQRSVTFVHAGPEATTWERAQRVAVRERLTLDHVMASAAVPIVFPAVRIGDEFYGDGSVGQLAPLAPALHLGASAIVAIGAPQARPPRRPSATGDYPSVAEVMGLLFRAIFFDALEADAERLERVNRTLAALPPQAAAPDGLRPVDLLVLRPSRDLSDLAIGHTRLLPPLMRGIIRAIGGQRDAAAEFLGYLLFHPSYTTPLAELGYEDVAANWPAIEGFFDRQVRGGR